MKKLNKKKEYGKDLTKGTKNWGWEYHRWSCLPVMHRPVGAVHYSTLHGPSVLDTPALQDCAET